MSGNAGGGGTGKAGGTDGAAGGSSPGASGVESAPVKTGTFEVLDPRGDSLGQFGQAGKLIAPNVNFKPEVQEPVDRKHEREPARELTKQIAQAQTEEAAPRPDAEIARAIERRAELHEAAYVQAKQPMLDALPNEAGQVARLAELRNRDIDVLPLDTAQKWAEADARDFRKLQDLDRQGEAAVTMAEVGRTNAAYRAALAEKSPDVAERVRALDSDNAGKVEAKDERKKRDEQILTSTSEPEARMPVKEEREPAPELSEQVAGAASDPAPKLDADTAAEVAHRGVPHEAASVQPKEPALNPVSKEADHAERPSFDAGRYGAAYRESLEQVSPDLSSVGKERKAANESIGPLREAANERSGPVSASTIDAAAYDRVAAARTSDRNLAAAEMGLNRIEPAVDVTRQQRRPDVDEAGPSKAHEVVQAARQGPTAAPAQSADGNQVVSDEVFTASSFHAKLIVPIEVERKYLRVGNKYYHPQSTDVVAFQDKGNRLETKSNSEQVADTMVAIARARGWDEIKVSGSETFRKEVWLEAAAHGMQVKGYSPSAVDKAELAKRTGDIDANKVEPANKRLAREIEIDTTAAAKQQMSLKQAAANGQTSHDQQSKAERVSQTRNRAQAFAHETPNEAVKQHPELAGSYAVMTTIERKLDADNMSPQQRSVVSARVRANVLNAIERGNLPEMRVREERQRERQRSEEREVTR